MKSLLFLFIISSSISAYAQIDYDVLQSEDFDNTTNLTASGANGFGASSTSATCGNNNVFDVNANTSDPTDMPACIQYETGSFFAVCDKDAAGLGTSSTFTFSV